MVSRPKYVTDFGRYSSIRSKAVWRGEMASSSRRCELDYGDGIRRSYARQKHPGNLLGDGCCGGPDTRVVE
jgi:hypothetical protein